MQITFKGKRIGVEKTKKQGKKDNSYIIVPESEEYVGIIKYVGSDADPAYKIGQRVYFTTDHQNMRIGGAEICVMEDKSIVAVIDEENTDSKA